MHTETPSSPYPARKLKKVTIHTDGACAGNPGPGGWAAIVRYGPKYREISGGAPETTNNRMELQAAIEALNLLNQPCEVELWTDSEYLRLGITQWMSTWKRRGWRTVDRRPVKNQDLWRALDEAASRHVVHWNWIRGHSGHQDNERCDKLARAEISKIQSRCTPSELAMFPGESVPPQEHGNVGTNPQNLGA